MAFRLCPKELACTVKIQVAVKSSSAATPDKSWYVWYPAQVLKSVGRRHPSKTPCTQRETPMLKCAQLCFSSYESNRWDFEYPKQLPLQLSVFGSAFLPRDRIDRICHVFSQFDRVFGTNLNFCIKNTPTVPFQQVQYEFDCTLNR